MLTDDVRNQDKVFVMRAAAANKKGGQMTWEFLCENWDAFMKLFDGGFLVGYLAKMPGLSFTTSEKAEEVETFFKGKKEGAPAAARAMDQCVETINVNAS